MHGLEADRRQLARGFQRAELDELLQAEPHRGRVVRRSCLTLDLPIANLGGAARHGRADALDRAARQQRLAVHLEQAILEAGAAQVGDQDLHRQRPASPPRTPRNWSASPSTSSTPAMMMQIIEFFLATGSFVVKKQIRLKIRPIRLQQTERMIPITKFFVYSESSGPEVESAIFHSFIV